MVDATGRSGETVAGRLGKGPTGPANLAGGDFGTGAIEIVLANGRLVRVGTGVDPDALRRGIAVLENPA